MRPPLKDPPRLESFQALDNKGVEGYWMNKADGRELGEYFTHIWNVKDLWK